MIPGQSTQANQSCNSAIAKDSESESQIRNALCYTEELTAQLHGEITALEHRLETGLTPLPPQPAGTNGADIAQCRSHVLERVGNTNQILASASARLRELRMRVEL